MSKFMVVAMHFGTTYSSYAYSLKHQYERDSDEIYFPCWAGANGRISYQIPTVLLLNEEKKFLAFGYEAENEYCNYKEKGLHKTLYYFQRFKMLLYQKNKNLEKNCMLKDVSGKELPAMTVFSESINFFKNKLMETCNNTYGLTLQASEIEWVLTVPAFWKNAAKQFMQEAAEKAGIPNECLKIAFESEAASMFWKHIPLKNNRDGSKYSLSIFKPGDKYMVLITDGVTMDITCFQVGKDGSLSELHHDIGVDCGGTQVDEEFKQWLIKLVGYPVLKQFCDSNPSDYVNMKQEFNSQKKMFDPCKKRNLVLRIPLGLFEIFEEFFGEKMRSINNSPLKKTILIQHDKLKIDSAFFEGFFKKPSFFVDHVKELLAEPCYKGMDKILLVGELADCPVFQEKVFNTFPDMLVYVPYDADFAVVKGAVLYGHDSKEGKDYCKMF